MSTDFQFLSFQMDVLGQQSGAVVGCAGRDEAWAAPVAWFFAPQGFGEDSWVDQPDQTVISWARKADEIHCHFGRSRGRRMNGSSAGVTLQPAKTPNHFTAEGPVEFAQFYVPAALIRHVADSLTGRAFDTDGLRDDLQFTPDQVMYDELDRYLSRARDPVPPTRLELESRAILIVERLFTRHHDLAPPAPVPLRRDWRLRRAMERMEAGLADDIGLAELAATVDLSPGHLTALFRAGVGETPHRWLNRRRIERACEMLADPKISVTEIALACGFSSSQHFATAFRKQTGVTPSNFRRERSS